MDSTTNMGSITADASEGGVYCVAGGGGLYYSQDYGINWTYKNGGIGPITGGCFAGEIFCGFTFSADYGSTLTVMEANGFEGWFRDATAGRQVGEYYVINDRGQLYFSTEYGDTFNLQHDFGYPQGRFWSLRRGAVSGEVYLLCRISGQLYYSSDYGETFKEKKQFPGEDYFWVIDMVGGVNQGDVFVERYRIYSEGGGEIQIYYSADYGSTFVEYKHVFDAVEEEQEGGGLPRQVELGQNWPNPFNSTTAISYQLSANRGQQSAVGLKIYNLLGQEVRMLVDKLQKGGGDMR